VKILTKKFFPLTSQVQSNQHIVATQASSQILVEIKVTQEEIARILQALPISKASGPDQIPNEILKTLSKEISEGLARGVSMLLAVGTLSKSLKELTTIAL
jgi:hypothetical protein